MDVHEVVPRSDGVVYHYDSLIETARPYNPAGDACRVISSSCSNDDERCIRPATNPRLEYSNAVVEASLQKLLQIQLSIGDLAIGDATLPLDMALAGPISTYRPSPHTLLSKIADTVIKRLNADPALAMPGAPPFQLKDSHITPVPDSGSTITIELIVYRGPQGKHIVIQTTNGTGAIRKISVVGIVNIDHLSQDSDSIGHLAANDLTPDAAAQFDDIRINAVFHDFKGPVLPPQAWA